MKRTVTQGIQAEAHVIDEEDEEKALRFAHEGHWGIKKTYWHLKRANIHMKRMYHKVREFVRRCPQCQANAGKELRERFRYLPVKDFNDVVAADFGGPYSLPFGTGSRYLLVLVNYVSRFTQLEVTKKCDSNVVKSAMLK